MIKKIIDTFFDTHDNNTIGSDIALAPHLVGMKMFDEPLIGVASVTDAIFESFEKQDEIMYQQFMRPEKWLDSAKSVVSIFLPYTEHVKKGNATHLKRPSMEWLHGRYEGQQFIVALSKFIQNTLVAQGHKCIVPCLHEDLIVHTGTQMVENKEDFKALTNREFWSSWSERHVAFATGLGTFGLSKNIITAKGSAGRFTSFITDLELPITQRTYTEVYEYCTFCGACISNCPVNAIHMASGKHHTVCSRYLDWVFETYQPRYACGKCQVAVPCQDGIPTK